MDVYRGADKVATLGSYDELRVGANKPAFIYEGAELVYPAPIRNGLILWYDFSGRTNNDVERGVAEDLSGNENHGTLQNFNHTTESGYDKNKLSFDGVDDGVSVDALTSEVDKVSIEIVFKSFNTTNSSIVSNGYYNFEVAVQSSGGIQLYYSDGSASNYRQPVAPGNYNDGNLHHIVACFHKDLDKVILYDKGVEVFSSTNTEELDMSGTSSAPVNIGMRPPNSNRNWDGHLFSTRLYNRPLTPEEIAHNYAIEKERFGI